MQSLLLVVTAIAVLGLSAARGDDWPHWRGPDRNDHSPEDSGFSAGHWPLGDADWNASLGIGSASPIVVGDRLYTLGWHEGREHVVCLDIATGKTLWSESYPAPQYGRKATGDEGIYGGPSSTPEYDPATKLLYTLGADGDLHCWRTATGKQRKVWGKNLYQEYDPPQRPRFGRSGLRDYGYTSSPLVQGDVLIVEVGDEEGTLMAFDKRSGQRRWKSECIDAAGHSGGPVPMTVEGVPCVA
ncbi:MAG: PQQ-binding-like beta-propeller repeat protein, partial [Pirellulales bacterium]